MGSFAEIDRQPAFSGNFLEEGMEECISLVVKPGSIEEVKWRGRKLSLEDDIPVVVVVAMVSNGEAGRRFPIKDLPKANGGTAI